MLMPQVRPPSGPHLLVMGSLCALALAGTSSPASAQARSLTWTEVTTIEMPGTMGALLRATGSLGDRRSEHGIHLQGSVLRQDEGSSSSIFDAGGRRFISMDHEARSYLEFTFEESAQMAREMVDALAESRSELDEALRESQAERDEAMEEFRRNMDALQEAMTFRIETQATGERRQIDGMSAERYLISAELEARDGVEGMEDVEGGQVVFLVDLWQTREFPDFDAFMEEWARELAADPAMQALARDMAESLEPLAGEGSAEMLALWDPRIAAGVQQVMEAMEELDGTTLESRTLVALVEPGATLDRAELLAWEPASMGDQLRGQAGETARAAAQEAARGAVRGLSRGLLGRGGGGGGQAEEQRPPQVRPMLRVSSLRQNTVYSPDGQGMDNLLGELATYRAISLADLMREIPTGR
jgi:vacuolar-type H+-ATPase subunit E/Vma4